VRGVVYDVTSDSFQVASEFRLTNPISLCVHVNRKCNLLCFYCLTSSAPEKPGEIGTLERLFRFELDSYPLRIVWSGGEPLMERQLAVLLPLLKENGCANVVTTNGTTLPRRDLIPYIDWLDVSIHGIDRATYRHTTSHDMFDRTMQNLGTLCRSGVRVSANLLVTRSFIAGIFPLALKLRDLRVRRLRLSRLLPLGRGAHEMPADPSDEEILLLRERLGTLGPELTLVVPAIRKRASLLDGYFVLENDGALSSPPGLAGLTLRAAASAPGWKEALESHIFLFDGIND
jgi:MoaA/NifB/PqqE/SkfB family radical SAM enzyme